MCAAEPVCRPGAPRLRRVSVVALIAVGLATMSPDAAHAEQGLEEVVVTAQRQSERIQDVPIAITALSASDLADRGVRQAGDITASVPNMLLNSPYGPEAPADVHLARRHDPGFQ